VLNAAPYAFLDDAPLEERRTQAVQSRRWNGADSADDLGRLDPEAIAAVRDEAWPQARNADEMHEALNDAGLCHRRGRHRQRGWDAWLQALAKAHRATRLTLAAGLSGMDLRRKSASMAGAASRGRTRCGRPSPRQPGYGAGVEPRRCAARTGAPSPGRIRPGHGARAGAVGLPSMWARSISRWRALQTEGYVMQGRFTAASATDEPTASGASGTCWHASIATRWAAAARDRAGRADATSCASCSSGSTWPPPRVSGPEALPPRWRSWKASRRRPALWEAEVLPARVKDYASSGWTTCARAGRTMWTRLRPLSQRRAGRRRSSCARRRSCCCRAARRRLVAPWPAVAIRRRRCFRSRAGAWPMRWRLRARRSSTRSPRPRAPAARRDGGRAGRTGGAGRANCDSYAGLRALLLPAAKRATAHRARGVCVGTLFGIEDAGRWSWYRPQPPQLAERSATRRRSSTSPARCCAATAWCFRLLEREAAWLPPWRELVRVYRRLEARGEIRGGRFIAGVTGEQFALPEAIATMRAVRKRAAARTNWCASVGVRSG
jgi:ATP-dependent Lhr-like helicase